MSPSVEGAGRKKEARQPRAGREKRPERLGEPISKGKRLERERRLAGARRRLQLRALLFAAAIAAVVLGIVGLYNSSAFPVRRVEVAGNKRLTAEEIRVLARVPNDATLLRFPADAVGRRVAGSPWVESVKVTRDFPDGLLIRVQERTPAVRLDDGSDYWLVDARGFVLGRAAIEETRALPVIRDVRDVKPKAGSRIRSYEFDNAVRIIAGLSPSLRRSVRAVSAPSIDRTAVYTSQGVEIFFGEAVDLDKKDLVARSILREQKGKVVSINVRSLKAPTWHGLAK